MISLQSRKDAFRLLLPKEFLCKEIEQKYTEILLSVRGNCVSDVDEESIPMYQTYEKINSSDSCRYRLKQLLKIVKILEQSESEDWD